MSKKIPDISYWQGNVNWTEDTKRETDYVIMRASCGTAKDLKFQANARGAAGQEIPYGVYHYLMCLSIDRAKNEADAFYNAVVKSLKTLPTIWVLDVEEPSLIWKNGKSLPMNPNLKPIVKAFAAQLRSRIGDEASIWFYGGKSVYDYGGLSAIPWDGIWIANYGKNTGDVCSSPGMACELHQFTSKGKWNGKNPVDLNRLFNGFTLEKLAKMVSPVEAISPAPVMQDDPKATEEMENAPAEKPTIDLSGDGLIVRCTEPYAWNIRKGDGTGFESIGTAYQGYEWEYVATSTTGWICIRLPEGALGWISPKAAKVVNLHEGGSADG